MTSRTTTMLALLAAVASGCPDETGSTRSTGGEASAPDAGARSEADGRPGYTEPEPLDAGVRDLGAAESPRTSELRDAGARDASGPSPWGASRAEQCAGPERPMLGSAAQQAFDLGVGAASRGELVAAKAHFERALSEDRRAYRAAYNLGVLADRMGRETEAMDYYRQALRIVPSYEAAIEGIVLIHLRRGRTQDALEFVRPLSVQFGWNDAIHATYARVLGALSRWDEAFREARLGLRCDERSVAALTALAFAAHGQNNVEMANWILERITSVEASDAASSRYAESHYLRGLIHRSRPGEVDRAVREFEKAVQLREDYVDARMALGQLLLATGNYPAALAHLAAASSAAQWSWQVRLAYADALRSNGRYDDAKREIERVNQLAPNQPEGHLALGLVLLEEANCLRTGEASAIPTCSRALNELGQYRSGMGSRLPSTDRTSETIQSLTRILERLEAARAAAAAEAAERSGPAPDATTTPEAGTPP